MTNTKVLKVAILALLAYSSKRAVCVTSFAPHKVANCLASKKKKKKRQGKINKIVIFFFLGFDIVFTE
jgi:hypothetical protein